MINDSFDFADQDWESFGCVSHQLEQQGGHQLEQEHQRVQHQEERVRSWEVQEAVRKWAEFQAGQRILVTTPSIVVGYRAQVYRAEGATQWYTAVIVGHDEENGVCAPFFFFYHRLVPFWFDAQVTS